MRFFRKIILFFLYRKQIIKGKQTLLTNFNSRIDYVFRIYTVLNIPKELIEEPYDFRTSDINAISQNYIKAFSNEIQNYLNSLGLRELVDVYEIKKVDKYSYLVVIGYSLFNTRKVANNLIYLSIFMFVSLLIYLVIYSLFN